MTVLKILLFLWNRAFLKGVRSSLRICITERGQVKYAIEVLSLNGAGTPKVLYTFFHTASSMHLVRASLHSVMKSQHWPREANGFRIVSEQGVELYGWRVASAK